MKKNMKTALLCTLIILALPITLSAQITVGSKHAPNKGALLDLKEKDTAGENSSKGLGLPRVELTTLSNLSDLNVAPTKEKEHTGLMVYHTTADDCSGIPAGIYIWMGSKWEELSGNTGGTSHSQEGWIDNGDGTGVLTDYEGNRYRTKKFGNQTWMTDNLRATRKTTGELIDCAEGVRMNPALYNLSDLNTGIVVKGKIPNGTIKYKIFAEEINETTNVFATKYGLMYTQAQAQEACPAGWELPSETVWQELGNFMVEGAGMDWKNLGAGIKMKASNDQYTSAEGTVRNWGGYPLSSPENRRFYGLPAGNVTPEGDGSRGVLFGEASYWWAAESTIFAHLTHLDDELHISYHPSDYFFSVRCVKN